MTSVPSSIVSALYYGAGHTFYVVRKYLAPLLLLININVVNVCLVYRRRSFYIRSESYVRKG